MAESSGADLSFYQSYVHGFIDAKPEDDLLHPDQNKLVQHPSATETQYFGFNIPEAGINGLGYMWHHARLRTITGGLFVWQGVKPATIAAELCDMRDFMSDDAIRNDLHDYRLDNGYGVRIVEPLKKHHVTYVDPARHHELDLHYEAVCPPVVFDHGAHFEQPMRVRGNLVLRGKKYKVDGYHVRDRSWGKPRHEDNVAMPPFTWVTGAFNDDFSFNCAVLDDAREFPELRGTEFELSEDKILNAGWIYRHGTLRRIIRARKRVKRDMSKLLTHSADFEFTDDRNEKTVIRATMIASLPWAYWPNMHMQMTLMRWECDGLIGHGDYQEVFWNDYATRFCHET